MRILMISKKDTHCGVADYGRRVYEILKGSMDIMMREVNSSAIDYTGYDVVLYNYHHATMPFINDDTIPKGIKTACIFHEGPLHWTPDIVLNTNIRPLFNVKLPAWKNVTPTIGSFGFGFPDKNFTRVCEEVRNQYEYARVRLNIPFAYYGDRDGVLAKREAQKCAEVLKGSYIDLQVTHDYMSPPDLLKWLADNDINLFLYKQSHGRGIASATDYALSVDRPIGVSDSEMFRHLPASICIDNTPLRELTTDLLAETKEKHSNEKLIEYYKRELSYSV